MPVSNSEARQEGYYWVRLVRGHVPHIAEWSDGSWWLGANPVSDPSILIILSERLEPPK